ncbi:hypothetical protein WMY93_023550 [Mugilogobius chulae]|uniref:CD44 antigen n=1 Tax=Mugilogobius chulae TaxID=88201 RepID=A0AAW0NGQ6_9GOBI
MRCAIARRDKQRIHTSLQPGKKTQHFARMWNLILGLTFFGYLGSSQAVIQVNARSCSFAGVFLIEGEQRHSLNYKTATEACEQLGAVMASPDQVQEAYSKNMETCRNGWMNNETTAILRHTSHGNCAKNLTGLIINSHVTTDELFDAYCFNETAPPEKDCSQAFTEFETPSEPGELSTPPNTDMPIAEESDLESTTTNQLNQVTETEDPTMNITLSPETGSGFMPTVSEEEGETFTTAHVEDRDEQRPDIELDNHGESKSQAEAKGDTAEFIPTAPGTGRMNSVQDNGPKHGSQESGGPSNWLVIVGVIVAVAAILVVCAVVAKRNTLCGKQQTLMITSKDGGEGNGTAMSASSSHAQEREQEMVTLMNKEKIQENGNTEEFTVITLEESPDKDQTA